MTKKTRKTTIENQPALRNKMMEIIPTVGVLVLRGNEVLLVRHEAGAGHLTGTYGLAMGRIEDKELEIEAAVRELFEETGITTDTRYLIEVPEKEYVAEIVRKDGTVKKFSLKLFVCKKFHGEIRKGNEETTPEWKRINEITNLNLLPNVDKMISDGVNFVREKNL